MGSMRNLIYAFCFLITVPITAQETLDNLLKVLNSHSVPYISIAELQQQQANDTVYLLDAREKNEYDVSRISSSTNIGYSEFSINSVKEQIENNDAPIVVYCSLGVRSEAIGEKLKSAGYTNVKNLYGGIFKWKNKGYAVIDSTGSETEKVHAYSKLWGKWLTNAEKVYD